MTAPDGREPRLDPDPESLAIVRALLDRCGYDTAQQWLRPDYFTSPFPNYEPFAAALAGLAEPLAVALRLFSLAQPVAIDAAERALGREAVEAGLATGLLVYDPAGGAVGTGGFSLVSRLGLFFVVSTNPYYPTFDPANADVYLGPDSFALAGQLDRLAPALPDDGRALDLCCGSGIAGQTAAARLRGVDVVGVDLAPAAVAAAAFNAGLNGLAERYRTVAGDLYAPLGDARFDLIVCNPPFIPVPAGRAFPGYGAGGEDGLAVLRPIVEGLGRRLSERGTALIYAEGIGDEAGPALRHPLAVIAGRDGLDAELTIVAAATVERALLALGRLLARQRPSRLAELAAWEASFRRQGVRGYFKFFLTARPGRGTLRLVPLARPGGA